LKREREREKESPVGAVLFRAERQTDVMKVVVAYLNFAHALNMTHFAQMVYICVLCDIFT